MAQELMVGKVASLGKVWNKFLYKKIDHFIILKYLSLLENYLLFFGQT